MALLGSLLLVCMFLLVIKWINHDGLLFFANYSRIGCLIWLVGLGLYDLQLSGMYHPSVAINLVAILIIINFFVLSITLPSDINKVYMTFTNITNPKRKSYSIGVFFTLFCGIISFVVNLNAGLLRYFISNAGMRVQIRLSYFLHLMVIVSLFFYFQARTTKKHDKVFLFAMSGFALFMIFANLSRGPLLFWACGISFFELCQYIAKGRVKKNKCKKVAFTIIFVFFLLCGIWAFGFIGDMRTTLLFGTTATEYYLMPEGTPSGFTWVYIYLTSPLENARFILEQETAREYSFFNKLLYPAIKLFANVIWQGDKYSSYVQSFNSIYPYLWTIKGLNVSSFIADAIQDLGYLGIVIYVFCYDMIAIIIHKIIESKKIENISKAIMIPILFQISLWSIFSNSVMNVSIIWVDVFFVYLWDLLEHVRLSKKSNSMCLLNHQGM